MDLRATYHQLELGNTSKDKLNTNTHEGLYKYNHTVIGISPAMTIWENTIDQTLKDIPETTCILYDMIITGKQMRNFNRI